MGMIIITNAVCVCSSGVAWRYPSSNANNIGNTTTNNNNIKNDSSNDEKKRNIIGTRGREKRTKIKKMRTESNDEGVGARQAAGLKEKMMEVLKKRISDAIGITTNQVTKSHE